jgi:hypothetical protein
VDTTDLRKLLCLAWLGPLQQVRDLLRDDGPALRLLDSPEHGLVIERLTEEGVPTLGVLKGLLAAAEQRRQARPLDNGPTCLLRAGLKQDANGCCNRATVLTLG